MSGFSLLLKRLKSYKPFKNKNKPVEVQPSQQTSHFAHLSCTSEPLPKELPNTLDQDTFIYSYQSKQHSGFIIVDVTRNKDSSDVVYTIKHLPSGKLFRFSKQVFEFLFTPTIGLS